MAAGAGRAAQAGRMQDQHVVDIASNPGPLSFTRAHKNGEKTGGKREGLGNFVGMLGNVV